jgi:serine/threonine protein kinase
MVAGTEPARRSQPRTSGEDAARAWLDALVSGVCTPETFLGAMHDQFQGDRDEDWEIVSLVDQYYRRGKISAEIFNTLQSRLQNSALNGGDAAGKAQVHAHAHAANTVTAPVGASVTDRSPASRPAASAVRDVAIGDVLRNRYRVQGILGAGGMGTVFEAIDEYRLDLPIAGQRIAIKVLHTAPSQREELLRELQREFQHLQLLSHPNVIRVHEFDRDGDIAFFTMELLHGALLSHVLTAGNATPMPRRYALTVMRDVGSALAHAHSRGVVHGDINPQNIFITNAGEVRVLDFGASHNVPRGMSYPDEVLPPHAPVATPGYASCQVLEGQRPDARDDIFAFACVAYVLLSGRHPFPKRTAVKARAQRLRPRRPSGLTGQQWRALREALRWERERRPVDVQKWLNRLGLAAAAPHLPPLATLLQTSVRRKHKAVLASVLIMVFALLAGAGYWAITHYDSHTSSIKGPSDQEESAPASSGATATPAPPVPESKTTAQPQTPPVTAAPPSTHDTPRVGSLARTSSNDPPRADSLARTSPNDTSRSVNAGPVRIEMAADTVDVPAGETAAHIVVRRKGSLHDEASFTWWTESGTAKPGRDFAPMTPHVEHIADGSNSLSLSITVSATPRTQPKSFYVVIDRTESGPALGTRTLTLVTLQPTG